jgi:hypothetical protein
MSTPRELCGTGEIGAAISTRMAPILHRLRPGCIDPIKALRRLLKLALRACGLRAVSVYPAPHDVESLAPPNANHHGRRSRLAGRKAVAVSATPVGHAGTERPV